MQKKIVSKRNRKKDGRWFYFNLLKEHNVPEDAAKLVFSKEFKVYPFAFPSKKKDKRKREFTYEHYRKAINPDEKARIAARFLVDNYELLREVEREYGISAVAMASLVAVESSGGNFFGNFKMFNAVFSNFLRMRSINTNRAKTFKEFYLSQIKAIPYFLNHGYSPFVTSSKAGAIGYVQFMLTTLLQFGVDADNDGRINLFSKKDALHSAANYLDYLGARNNLKQAFSHYNGHEWFALVLLEVMKKASFVLEREYSLELKKLNEQKNYEIVNFDLLSMMFLRSSLPDNYVYPEIRFISLLELFTEISSSSKLFLYPSKQESIEVIRFKLKDF